MTDSARHERTPLVLIINDQEWSTRSLESILSPNGYAVLRAYTGAKGVSRAETSHPDVIIVGASLPDMDGLEVCRQLRSTPGVLDSTPIVVTTTAHVGRDERLAALRAGAWDYLGDPLDAEELLLRFDAFVRAKHDADRARHEGLVDVLTGLYSLAGLARRARELGSQAYRQSGPLACVVFSAEGGADDEIITTHVAQLLAGTFRAAGRMSDAIGRIGEMEFALFAPATDRAGAARLAERLAGSLRASVNGGGLRVLTGYHAVEDFRDAGLQPHDILERATQALNETRRRSGGRPEVLAVN